MSTVEQGGVALETLASDELSVDAPAQVVGPIRVHGKFFFAGDAKHFVKGVTYGPFAIGTHGSQFPERAVVGRDFALMRGAGINTVRVFTVPPVWLLDMAEEAGLRVLVGPAVVAACRLSRQRRDQGRDPRGGRGRGACLLPSPGGFCLSRGQ